MPHAIHEMADSIIIRFYNIPLRIKLSILVISALIGIIILGFVGVTSTTLMSTADIRMYEENVVVLGELSTLSVYTSAYARAASELRGEKNDGEILRLTGKLQRYDTGIRTSSENLLSLLHPDLLPDAELFIAAYERYKVSIDKSFELYDLGYFVEANTLYRMEAGPLYYAAENALISLIQAESQFAHTTAQENQKIANQMKTDTILAVFFIGFLLIGLSWLIIQSISSSIQKCVDMLHELRNGHVSARLHLSQTDEIGQMGAALDAYAKHQQVVVVGTLHALAKGEKEIMLVPTSVSDSEDEVSPALNAMIQTISDLMQQISTLIENAQNGKLEVRGDADAFVGQYHDIVLGINMMLDAITIPLAEVSRVLTTYADVDFSERFNSDIIVRGEFAELKHVINAVGEHVGSELGQAIDGVQIQMKELVASSHALRQNLETIEIIAEAARKNTSQTEENAKETKVSVAHVLSEIEGLNTIVTHAAAKLDITNDLATKMDHAAMIGTEKTEATEAGLKAIRDSVAEAYVHMTQIMEQMQLISSIAIDIRSIANATNILALNAGLEAARAGDFGASFGIVADEVKSLSDQSFGAAQEISDIILKLKKQSTKVESSMSQATMSVETGTTAITETIASFHGIIEQVTQINDQVSELHDLTIQESESFETIVASMSHVMEMSTETFEKSLSSAQGSAKAIQSIAELQETVHELSVITGMIEDAIHRLR